MRVHVFGTLRSVMGGGKEVEVPLGAGATVEQMLERLTAAYPGLHEKLQVGVSVFVNGRSTSFLAGPDTALQEGDRVAMFPPVAGG